MGIDEIVGLFVNNTIGVACIIYFCVRDWKFMDTLTDTLSTLKDSVKLIQDHFIDDGRM